MARQAAITRRAICIVLSMLAARRGLSYPRSIQTALFKPLHSPPFAQHDTAR